MQNDMRDRLVELLKEASYYLDEQDVVCNRVADHLIANGVIVPPCKMGDKIYMLVTRQTTRFDFTNGKMKKVISKHTFVKETRLTKLNLFSAIENFGKTIFLTKDQAEQKLKEMIGNSAK